MKDKIHVTDRERSERNRCKARKQARGRWIRERKEESRWRNPIIETASGTCALCDINADVRVKHGRAQTAAV